MLFSRRRHAARSAQECAFLPSSPIDEAAHSNAAVSRCVSSAVQQAQRPQACRGDSQHDGMLSTRARSEEYANNSDTSLPSDASAYAPSDPDISSTGSDGATASSRHPLPSRCFSVPGHAAHCSYKSLREFQMSQGVCCLLNDSCSSCAVPGVGQDVGLVEAQGVADDHVATKLSRGFCGAQSTRLYLSRFIGWFVKWFEGSALLKGCNKLVCKTLHAVLLFVIRLQRQQLLRRFCPDLTERDCACEEDANHSEFTGETAAIASSSTAQVDTSAVLFAEADAVPLDECSSSGAESNCIDTDCRGQVFFFVHGLLESSLNWISGGDLSLPFLVATRGGEVWLANSRGNEYTRKVAPPPHKRLHAQQQHAGGFTRLHPNMQQDASEQGRWEAQGGFSLSTLHAFIAEEKRKVQNNRHHLRQPSSSKTQHTPQHQPGNQELPHASSEEECCSLFCCRCSGLSSVPRLQGKPQEAQQQILRRACREASELLFWLHWSRRKQWNAAVREAAEQPQQHDTRGDEPPHGAPDLTSGKEATPNSAKGGSSPTCRAPEQAVDANMEGAATSSSDECSSSTLHSCNGLKASEAEGTAVSKAAFLSSSACSRPPSSCNFIRERPQTPPERRVALPSAVDIPQLEEKAPTDRKCDEDTACTCCSRPRGEGSFATSSCKSGSRRNKVQRIYRGRCSATPPLKFSKDLAEGSWSFHEMAMYDCAAQMQYIAINSPTLHRRRAAMLAAPAAFTTCNNEDAECRAFGCGIVAIGQSQGAAQLLAALSTCPSLSLLACRLVLFSPPLILQPLHQLPYVALVLLRLGSRHPTLLLKILRFVVHVVPEKFLAAVGNAVVGCGMPGSMRFYSTPLQHKQLVLNFTCTPSGGTSRRNFEHWLQQLTRPKPLSTLVSPRNSSSVTSLPVQYEARALGQKSAFLNDQTAQSDRQGFRQPTFLEATQPSLPDLTEPHGRYPLERISSEVYAFLGSQDNLVSAGSSAAYLESCIPKERLHLYVVSGLGHLDFGGTVPLCVPWLHRDMRKITDKLPLIPCLDQNTVYSRFPRLLVKLRSAGYQEMVCALQSTLAWVQIWLKL
ncbi:hypothetical protein cyc_07962 [Cyclospora cayetanensis]|uniref:Partial AB-hydrolase lipase domain-containing protein n=1 Tax=Cyclospora cayetanensis TaxID=88456 RepID=A0A1D3D2V1_9EIME|nr:hypothetical protein cyc_07962 [Cyclospora cayetanensis]